MLRKLVTLFTIASALSISACKDQTPELPPISVPKPDPSIHLIENYYYAQFTWDKQQDTHTFEVLDDTMAITFEDRVNYIFEDRNEPTLDTTGAEEANENGDGLEPPFLKDDWHYAPATSMMYQYYYKFLSNPDFDFDDDELEFYERDVFTLYFPLVEYDTLPYWDIEDYLNNPMIQEGLVKWGRVGNNRVQDTIWNQDARDGVVISYIDTAGVEWRSDNWPTFQPFGFFKINRRQANLRDGDSYDIIEGEFAARLYNEDQGFKDMRFGKFRMKILDDIKLGDEPK